MDSRDTGVLVSVILVLILFLLFVLTGGVDFDFAALRPLQRGDGMKCPMKMMAGYQSMIPTCERQDCAWWSDGEKECIVKIIALELIKRNEAE